MALTGLTTNFNIPFPVTTDSISIITDLQDVAEAVDAALIARWPASSSDNALARFDGTTGKVLQNSGIVVNDSGEVTSNFTISKSNPILNLYATASVPEFKMSAPTSTSAGIYFQTVGVNRWLLGKNSDPESGSNAGSNFYLYRYDDAGSGLGSAITVNRSTAAVTLTGDVTITKATPIIDFNATSGGAVAIMRGAAGSSSGLQFTNTAGAMRWYVRKDNSSESGSDVGSDFLINRYNDAGTNQGAALTITRSTGKINIGSVGATAGLELGTSGPRIMAGTGSPESVVTAPVGSIWHQSDSTVGVTHWKKATGSGNTGWVVLDGNTGARIVTADLLGANGFTGGTLVLQRSGNVVNLAGYGLTRASGGAGNFYTLPTGFRALGAPAYARSFSDNPGYVSGTAAYINMASTSDAGISFTWITTDAWPTSLPGS